MEFVLRTGEAGCGKTTSTRLVNGLVPHYYEANLEGDVLLDGESVRDTPLYYLAAMVGSVFQLSLIHISKKKWRHDNEKSPRLQAPGSLRQRACLLYTSRCV